MAPQEINSSEGATTSKSQIERLARQNTEKKSIEQNMTGVHLVENSGNDRGWELRADEATGSSDELWVLKKVKVEFFSENISSFVVSGDIGEIDGRTKNMLIRGKVVTQSANGYQFITNDLKYYAEGKILRSDDSVEMIGPEDKKGAGFHLNGQGFKIDILKNKMFIESDIEASKDIDSKMFNVVSNEAEFSNKNQEALFSGNVIMTFDKTRITAPQAFFKYSEKLKLLESITLRDKVNMQDEGKTAVCKVLKLNLVDDSMTLSGQPKVQMGEDEIQGDEIIFLEGGKKVKINNVRIQGKELR